LRVVLLTDCLALVGKLGAASIPPWITGSDAPG
jgi:hypothetical protein